MAIYEIQGQQFEVPDEVQGAQLEQTLTQISESMGAAPTTPPQQQSAAQALPSVTASIDANQGRARQGLSPTVRPEQEKQAQDSVALNTIREGLQGLTLGTSDEIASNAVAIVAALKDGANYRQVQQAVLDDIQREQAAFREDEPEISTAAQLAGGLATGGAGLAKGVATQAGKGLLAKGATAAGTGAVEGGIAGAGFAEQGEKLEGAASGAAVGAIAGPVLAGAGGLAGRGVQKFKNNSEIKKAAADILQKREAGDFSGAGDAVAAGFKLNPKGKAVPDFGQRQAIKQGFDDGTVSLAAGSSPADKQKMLKMLNIVERSKGDKRFAALNRSDDVIGESIKGRLDMVMKANKIAGNRVRFEAKKLAGKEADMSGAVSQFADDLDEIGVNLVPTDGRLIPDFTNSRVQFNAAAKKAIANVTQRVNAVGDDALQGHELKKLIDDVVTFGKTKTGLAGEGERVLKRLRANVNQTLGENFPSYKKANDLFSDTITVIDDVKSAAGSKIDITGDNADKALGTVSRGIMSNNRGRQEVINTLNSLEDATKKLASGELGKKNPDIFKALDDDLVNQAVFAEELKQRFGAEAKTSLAGEAEKAVGAGVRAAAGDTFGLAADAARGASRKLSGIDDQSAFKAMRLILSE